MSDPDFSSLTHRSEERVAESRRLLEQARYAAGAQSARQNRMEAALAAEAARAEAHADRVNERLKRVEVAATRAAAAVAQISRTAERLTLLEAVVHDGLARVEALLHGLAGRPEHRVDTTLATQAAGSAAEAALESARTEERLAHIETVMRDIAVRAASLHPPVYGGQRIIATLIDDLLIGVPAEELRLALYHTFYGFQEPGVLSVFTGLLSPGSVVVDVGACIGAFTLHAARAVGPAGKVFAFEPAPRTFGVLTENLKFNGFHGSGLVDARPVAVSDHNGTAIINMYDGDFGMNSLYAWPGTTAREGAVQTARLDDALAGVERVDVVKIDAEGAERAVIAGMPNLLAANPALAIVMEFAPVHLRRANVDPGAFGQELLDARFRIRLIDDITGELRPIDVPELVQRVTSNILLQRAAPTS